MDIEPTRYISLFICSQITNNGNPSIYIHIFDRLLRKAILNVHEKQLTQFFFAALRSPRFRQ